MSVNSGLHGYCFCFVFAVKCKSLMLEIKTEFIKIYKIVKLYSIL